MLGDEKGCAGQNDGDVVMPSGERASFEVVESELALEVLIHALGAPPFLEEQHNLFLAHALGERREVKLGRLGLGVGPVSDEPLCLPGSERHAVIVCRLDAHERESRAQVLAIRTGFPGNSTKVFDELVGECFGR